MLTMVMMCTDMSEPALRSLVALIASTTGYFVEIVNLNIRNRQYVCAGDLRALDILQKTCDTLNKTPALLGTVAGVVEGLRGAYAGVVPQTIGLKRGTATVPLVGVDVPFHSSFLRPRMEAFRRVLQDALNQERLKPSRLVGKYVPNVTGTPFSLDREYMERAYDITKSERLGEVLADWDGYQARIQQERDAAAVDVSA